MRVVFVGASPLTVITTRMLLEEGHEVVIIEEDSAQIEELGDELDCGFVNGDGSRPAVLREVSPENADFLFCLSGSDQDNLIASLVGRTLGFNCIVTKIEDPDFEPVSEALGLENVTIPDREIATRLVDRVNGRELINLSKLVKGGLQFFQYRVGDDHPATIGELDLPADTLAIARTRGADVCLPGADTDLHEGDEVTLITNAENLGELESRWGDDDGSD